MIGIVNYQLYISYDNNNKLTICRFTLAVWTSMKNKNAKKIIKEIFCNEKLNDKNILYFQWYQSHCKLSEHHNANSNNSADNDNFDSYYRHKPLYQKELAKVWQAYPFYSEENTVLLTLIILL